jgi:hypothetical protein
MAILVLKKHVFFYNLKNSATCPNSLKDIYILLFGVFAPHIVVFQIGAMMVVWQPF